MKAFEITTDEQLQQAFAIRKEVFVAEQGVPEEAELDEFDILGEGTTHILVEKDGDAIATGRFRQKGEYGKVERVCVLQAGRGLGLGKLVMQTIEQLAREKGFTQLKLHGQKHAETFYHELGYTTTSEEFLEENIPHVEMTKVL